MPKDDNPSPAERVDQEFATQTTLNPGALAEEADSAHPPNDPGDLAGKIRAEAAAGDGIVDKAKRAFNELDRDISGEYERREDPTAPKP